MNFRICAILASLTAFVLVISCGLIPTEPVITDATPEATELTMGESMEIDVKAFDNDLTWEDNDDLTYTYELSDDTMGVVTGGGETVVFTALNKAGDCEVTITVSDTQEDTEDATTNFTVTISAPDAVYVSTSGNDDNCGSVTDKPVLSIQTAVAKADYYGVDIICVATGTYTKGSGLNNYAAGVSLDGIDNLDIQGGYDSNFESQTGVSVFDMGGDANSYCLYIMDATNLYIDNIALTRGYKGVSMMLSENVTLSNVTVTNVEDDGIEINSSTNIYVNATVKNLTNQGVLVYYSADVTIAGEIKDNNSLRASSFTFGTTTYYYTNYDNGTGIYADYVSNMTISASVSGNQGYRGAGIYASSCYNMSITGAVSGNKALYNGDGGGMYLDECHNATISGNVTSNYSVDYAGGVYIDWSTNATISGKVIGNQSTNDGGGIYAYYADYLDITSDVTLNKTGDDGGGMYLDYSDYVVISGSVTANTSGDDGGGIYFDMSDNCTISSTVSGNTASGTGGGYYNYFSTGPTVSGTVTGNTPNNY